jgi:2-amino-4-hydroxy-6-hydroxymethyldihydropteridine diphosphokinase
VYLGIGSNLGDRAENIRKALSVLGETDGITLRTVSSCYETEPVGPVTGQEDFYNVAAQIETTLSPRELLARANSVEQHLGRVRGERWGPRTIDIDILLWEDKIVEEGELTIPHPEMERRAFVLTPLAEIAPGAIHPTARKSIAELASQLDDTRRVRRLDVKLKADSHRLGCADVPLGSRGSGR